MIYLPLLISIAEVLIVTVSRFINCSFVTIAERKTMASMQRRIGPNIVIYYGFLQAFADALKLLLKECVSLPKPHAFVSLPVHSSMNFWLVNKTSLLLLTVFFMLALRWPIKTILEQSHMLVYFPLANTCISIFLAYFVAAFCLKSYRTLE